MRTIVMIAVALLFSGCGQARQTNTSDATETQVPSIQKPTENYKSPQGVSYKIERVPGIRPDQLPINSELKMADRDLVKYAETLCVLDVPAPTAPRRCDIYVQPDPNGTLIGYATITQNAKGVSFQTTTTTNEKKRFGGGACYIGGILSGSGSDWKNPISDASKDFSGQFAYLAWEKEPGNWMVSPMEGGSAGSLPENASGGMWYVEKKGDKLHIYQERWNYCYKDESINVDDVYYRSVTLVRN